MRTHQAASGISLPFDLSRITPAEDHQLERESPTPTAFRAQWSDSRTDSSASSTSDAEYVAPAHELFAKDSLLKAIRRHSAQFARTGKISARAHTQLRQPASFSKLGPAHKIRLLKSAGMLPSAVDKFINDNTKANLLKQVKVSLPGMASAFRCYTAFCELRKVPPFPDSEEVALQWSILFNNTAAFGNYISLLGRCCFFSEAPHVENPLRRPRGSRP